VARDRDEGTWGCGTTAPSSRTRFHEAGGTIRVVGMRATIRPTWGALVTKALRARRTVTDRNPVGRSRASVLFRRGASRRAADEDASSQSSERGDVMPTSARSLHVVEAGSSFVRLRAPQTSRRVAWTVRISVPHLQRRPSGHSVRPRRAPSWLRGEGEFHYPTHGITIGPDGTTSAPTTAIHRRSSTRPQADNDNGPMNTP